jgi:hypothetical protein
MPQDDANSGNQRASTNIIDYSQSSDSQRLSVKTGFQERVRLTIDRVRKYVTGVLNAGYTTQSSKGVSRKDSVILEARRKSIIHPHYHGPPGKHIMRSCEEVSEICPVITEVRQQDSIHTHHKEPQDRPNHSEAKSGITAGQRQALEWGFVWQSVCINLHLFNSLVLLTIYSEGTPRTENRKRANYSLA